MTMDMPEARLATDRQGSGKTPVSSLNSMTGFARVEGSFGAYHWAWEAKSVNGRGLDMRLRLPSGLDSLEPLVRKRINERFKRGNVQVNLQMTRTEGAATLQINEQALAQVLDAMAMLEGRVKGIEPARLDGLLNIRGVLDLQDPKESDEELEARRTAILGSFDDLIEAFASARAREGEALGAVIADQLDQIAGLIDAAAGHAASQPERLRERLRGQLAALGQDQALSEERLYQEAAILMTKADIREELDRLRAHLEAARELLGAGEAVGRRFDFLIQEFNREANTLCSKSNEIGLTRTGLELKVVIDQMREQIQNVE